MAAINDGGNSVFTDVIQPELHAVEVNEVTVLELSEEEVAALLTESGLDNELFGVPTTSMESLFLSFLQSVVKVISLLPSSVDSPNATSMLTVRLEYALDTITKLVKQAELRELSEVVLAKHPEIISGLLNFAVKVWQGKLRSDDIEDHAKTVIRLVWDLLESNQQAMKSVLTQELLKMLIGCLPLFKCPVTSVEVHGFISLYIMKLLRTCSRERAVCLFCVKQNCPAFLVQLVDIEQVEIRVLVKALLAHLIPYHHDLHEKHRLLEKVPLMEDELQFVLHILVASCESADAATKSVKITRFLELLKGLATCPTNRKAFLDAQNTLLGLAHGDDILTQGVISLSSNTDVVAASSTSSPPEADLVASEKDLLPEKSAPMKLSSERDDSFLELSGALFLHLAKGAHALVKHTENTECCVDESLMVESMTLANMLYTVAVLHCNPVQSKVVADRLAKFSSPGVIQGIVDMLHFCYVYNFTSDTAGIAAMVCEFLHSCLMQWTHHSPAMCKMLIGADLVYYLLKNLDMQKEKVDFDEYQVACTETVLSLLYNIVRRKDNLPSVYPADNAIKIVLPFTLCPLGKIGLLAKCMLSFLQHLIKDDQLSSLKLETDEINFFATSLSSAVESDTSVLEPDMSELESNVSLLESDVPVDVSALEADTSTLQSALDMDTSALESSELETDTFALESDTSALESDTSTLGFTAEEILTILINLSTTPGNQCALPSKEILLAVERVVQGSDRDLQCLAIHLLSNFTAGLRADLAIPESIVSTLCALRDDLSTGMGPLAHCLLQSIHQEASTSDPLVCCEGYYQLGKHEECIEWCDSIISRAKQIQMKQGTLNRAKLLKGKALYHSYQKPQIQFMKERQFISEYEVQHRIKDIYSKAKEAILLLGNALDNAFLDEEGSRFLDFAMMDYMRETNQLHDCRRCLLCRGRQGKKDMRQSHFIPKSVLKVLGKEFVAEGDHKYLLPVGGRISLKSPGECTFWMLCSVCEQRLSQNGEASFMEKFFPQVYGSQGPIAESSVVSYGSWLYSFCVGIIFRGLATERFAAVVNSDEVYEGFLACREHLRWLPAKMAADIVLATREENQPNSHVEVSLLINPVTLKEGNDSRLQQLATLLKTTGSPFLGMTRLYDGKPALSYTAHFFAAHFGTCNIITKFQPSSEASLPPWSIVNPTGGAYVIPEESQRWEHFPPGFWSAQLAAAFTFERVMNDFFVKTKSQHSTEQASTTSQEDVAIKSATELLRSLDVSDIFPSLSKVDHTVFSDFGRAPLRLNLLPKGYVIEIFSSGFVRAIQLPPGHQFILHATVNKKEGRWTTILLVGHQSSTIFYLIGVFGGRRGQIIDWVDIKSVNEDQDNLPLQGHLETDALLDRDTRKNILQTFPQVLKMRGFHSFYSVLQQIRCRIQCGNAPVQSLDQKCAGETGCWYCMELCSTCMVQPAVPGLSVADEKGEVMKHCSERCLQEYSSESVSLPRQVFQPSLETDDTYNAPICILRASKMIEMTGGIVSNVTMNLCFGAEDCKTALVLVHIRTRLSQHIFELRIDENLELATQVPSHASHFDQLEIADILKRLLQPALLQLGYSEFSVFLAHVTKTINL